MVSGGRTLHSPAEGQAARARVTFDSLTRLLKATAQALRCSSFPIWGEWEPCVDDQGFLEWREA